MVVVDFRITTSGVALAVVPSGSCAVFSKTLEARPVLEHASCVSAVGFTPSPSALVIPQTVASRQSLPPFHQIFLNGPPVRMAIVYLKSAWPVVGLFFGKTDALMLLVFAVVTPVRLHQDGIDLFGVDHEFAGTGYLSEFANSQGQVIYQNSQAIRRDTIRRDRLSIARPFFNSHNSQGQVIYCASIFQFAGTGYLLRVHF